MGDSHREKPSARPDGTPPAAKPSAALKKVPRSKDDAAASRSGHVVHDERGNAVWSYGRSIESTSHMLKKLELPELKLEDTQQSPELRIEPDKDAGGGYNPYGISSGPLVPPKSQPKAPANSKAKPSVGGGYDPYGKDLPSKTTRKR